MAVPYSLAGVQRIPNTALLSMGGRVPGRPQPVAPRQATRPQPSASSGRAAQILASLPNAGPPPAAPDAATQGGGGWKGALGKVLGNGAVKVALKPLQALGVPGNIVTTGIKETLDVVGDPLVRASDWLAKEDPHLFGRLITDTDEMLAKNPNYVSPYDGDFGEGNLKDTITSPLDSQVGFGTQLVEPAMGASGTDRALWVRQIAGFTGDIAADPLTYLSGGSAQVAGKGGRRALAGEAYAAGFSEEAIQRAAKGAAFLKPDERVKLGIEAAGLRFGGKNGVLIPHTEMLSNQIFRRTGAVREKISKVRPWQSINQNPKLIEEAAAVLSGQPGRLTHTQAAGIVAYDTVNRQAAKSFADPAGREAGTILGKLDTNAAIALTHATEAGGESALRPLMQKIREQVSKDLDIGDLGENYMPHLLTDDGAKLIDNGSQIAADLQKVIASKNVSGSALSRKLTTAGKHKIANVDVDFGNGTIAEINAEIAKKFPELNGMKLLEDDARNLVSFYINSIGSNLGKVKAFQHISQRSGGVGANLDDVADEIIKEFADVTANEAAAKAAKEVLESRSVALKAEKVRAQGHAKQLQKVITEKISDLLDQSNPIEARFKAVIDGIVKGRGEMVDARKEIAKTVTAMKKEAGTRLKAAEKEFFELEQQIEAAQIALSIAESKPSRLAAFNQMAQRKAALQAEIDAGRLAQQEIDQLSGQLAEVIAASQRLRNVADDPDEVQALAQKLMPSYEKEVQRAVEGADLVPNVTAADGMLKTINKRIDALTATLANDTVDEMTTIEGAIDITTELLTDAQLLVRGHEIELDKALRRVMRDRAKRGDLPIDTTIRPEDTIGGAGQALKSSPPLKGGQYGPPKPSKAEQELFEMLGVKDQMFKTWGDEGRELGRAATVEAITTREARNIDEAVGRFQGKADAAQSVVDDLGVLKEEFAGRADQHKAFPVIDRNIERKLDEAVTALRVVWIAKEELTKAVSARSAARKTVQDTMKGQAQPGRQLAEMDMLNIKIAQAEKAALEAASQLPPAEAAYVTILSQLTSAKAQVDGLKKMGDSLAREADRAARLGTPEANLRSIEAVREIVARQAMSNASSRPSAMETVVEVTQDALRPRAELQAAKEALPTTAQLSPPKAVRQAIEKVQLKGKNTARDFQKGVVPESALKAVPKEIADEFRNVIEQVKIVHPSADRAAQQELLERATTLGEFVTRYKAALDAGATAGDDLAARVTREVLDSELARTRTRFARMAKAVDAVDDSPGRLRELKSQFKVRLEAQADVIGDLIQRRSAAQRLMKGADDGTKPGARRIMTQGDEAVAERAELVAVVRETNERLDQEREFLGDMLKTLTGTDYGDQVRVINDTLRQVKPRNTKLTITELRKRADDQIEQLWKSTTPEARSGLMQEMKRTVQADQRAITTLQAKRTALGGDGAEVVADWKDVLLGRTGQGTLQAKAEALDTQLGAYGRTDEALVDARSMLSQDNKSLQGAIRAQQPAADRVSAAVDELAQGPKSIREATGADTIQTEIDDLAARQAKIAESADLMDAALRRIDPAAADEYRQIDNAIGALDLVKGTAEDQLEAAKKSAADLKVKLKAAEKVSTGSQSYRKAYFDLHNILKELPNSPELAPAFALQSEYAKSIVKMATMTNELATAKSMLAAAKDGTLHTIFKTEAKKGWTEVVPGLLPNGQRLAVQDEVLRSLDNVINAEPNEVGKAIDAMTQFFKAYATATPGFHVRNAMSAVYNNLADGVSPLMHLKAIKEWKAYHKDPMNYLEGIRVSDPKLYDAFMATFGSGVGGSYIAEEIGKAHGFIMDNRVLKTMHKIGQDIEGPARLAQAMDSTINRGSNAQLAMQRVSRVHIDYSQLSRADAQMKRMIPFWMFMSRNLPLQVQQMFMRPRLYSAYNRLQQSSERSNGFEGMPDWLADRSPFFLGQDDEGNEKILNPDMPMLGLQEDVGTFDMRNPMRVLSNLNPIFTAPAEAMAGKDFYYDNDLPDTSAGGRAAHIATSVFSPIAQAQRLSGSGKYEGKAKEKWMGFAGIPYREFSQEQIAKEMARQAMNG